MDTKYADFVDTMREELTQKVSLVMPLADRLLAKKMLHNEAYSKITAEKTSQAQMRELYKSLKSGAVKSEFYKALKEENEYLIEELEKIYRNKATQANETQNVSNIEWNSVSKRWKEKIQLLLQDQDRVTVGSLILCRKKEYIIGDGSNGTKVFLGIKKDGTEVAIKQINKTNNEELKNEMHNLRESKLDHSHIVIYVDFVEEQEWDYLALQLCDFNLNEYMKTLHGKEEKEKKEILKKIAWEVLKGLKDLHRAKIIHRDLKPWNVLIDEKGNVKLADFGISRRLINSNTTVVTTRAGTKGWEAAEMLDDGNENQQQRRYKMNSDIQVAGMLVYYILSDGDHPFGSGVRVEANILDEKYELTKVNDVEAKDLIESMIAKDPKKRLTAEEAVEHPFFWDDNRRDTFLRKIGDEEEIQKFDQASKKLIDAAAKYTEGRTFSDWKSKCSGLDGVHPPKNSPTDLRGLLRFLRNLLIHNKSIFEKYNMFKDLFPDYFISAQKLAKEMGWKIK